MPIDKITLMKQLIKERDTLLSAIDTQMKEIVTDQSIPLDERWELFISSDVGLKDSCYHEPDGINWDKMFLFDDFSISKYETVTAKSFVDQCEDKIKDGKEIDLTEVKKYFLKHFVKSFKNDW